MEGSCREEVPLGDTTRVQGAGSFAEVQCGSERDVHALLISHAINRACPGGTEWSEHLWGWVRVKSPFAAILRISAHEIEWNKVWLLTKNNLQEPNPWHAINKRLYKDQVILSIHFF